MIQEHDIISRGSTPLQGLPAAKAGIHLNPVAAQHTFGNHQVHLLVIHRQNLDSRAGEGLAACGLGFLEPIGFLLPVKQVHHGKSGERLADHPEPAVPAQNKITLRNHNHPQGVCQLLVVIAVLFVLCLCDENMGQMVAGLQLQQPVKIVGLISFYAQPLHHVHDHIVIISPDLITVVLLRPEIAGNTEPSRIPQPHGRCGIFHPLGDGNMDLESLLLFALEMNESTHSMKQAPGNG